MKEGKSQENEIGSDIANLSEKIPHQIKNNDVSEEKNKLLKDNDNEKLKGIKDKKIVKIEKKFNLKFEKIGATYIFLSDKENNPIITIGPHWIMFLLLFSFIIAGFSLLFYF